jgi:hypothetical protein
MKRIDLKILMLLLAICVAGCFGLRAQTKNSRPIYQSPLLGQVAKN